MDDDLGEYEVGGEVEYTPDLMAWYAVSSERLAEIVAGGRVRSLEKIHKGVILWLENDAGEQISRLTGG